MSNGIFLSRKAVLFVIKYKHKYAPACTCTHMWKEN